jgi:predicted molibdopterin-dependent oxidoreductase YjgC
MKMLIDDREVAVAEGTTVLEAARHAGISVPTLCYHPYLKPVGSCRLCVVDIEGYRGLAASCSTPAEEGMVVRSQTPRVREYRREMLRIIMKDYPKDALTPELVRLIEQIGFELPDKRVERTRPKLPGGPFFERDYHYCIRCGRCVRACQEIRGAQAIVFREINGLMEVGTAFGRPLEEAGCQFCAACVDICPTVALHDAVNPQTTDYEAPVEEVSSICPYCGVGCRLIFKVKGNRIISERPDPEGPANRGQACVKGRFGIAGFVHDPNRLTQPLVKKDQGWESVEWDEAIDFVAKVFSKYKPDEVAVIASAKCTNEDNYVFQKFARAVLHTNSVDHCARL